MRRSSFALVVGFCLISIALPFHCLTAQQQPGPASPMGPRGPDIQPAPDWLTWRVFYSSLEFYGRQSPSHVQEILVERVGLSVGETDVLLAAGRDYLQQLSRLDDSAKAEIKARFQSKDGPMLPLPRPPPSVPMGDSPPADLIRGQAPGGQELRQALVADGLIARVTNQRIALFAAHRDKLAQALVPAKLTALAELVRTEVAPGVKVVVADSPPRRAPIRPGSDSSVGERAPR